MLYLAGCTLEPHYQRPEPAVTPQWPAMPQSSTPQSSATPAGDSAGSPVQTAPDASQRSAAQIGWREFFTDPKLQTLIEQALQHNYDAQIATLNIAAARAQ